LNWALRKTTTLLERQSAARTSADYGLHALRKHIADQGPRQHFTCQGDA
jgi:hypothetical protein